MPSAQKLSTVKKKKKVFTSFKSLEAKELIKQNSGNKTVRSNNNYTDVRVDIYICGFVQRQELIKLLFRRNIIYFNYYCH